MLSIWNNRITLTQGDTAYITVKLSNYTYDEGDTLAMTVRHKIDDEEITFQIEGIGEEGNVINILPEHTKNLPVGEYVYDIRLTTHLGEVFTVVSPVEFIIKESVNRG